MSKPGRWIWAGGLLAVCVAGAFFLLRPSEEPGGFRKFKKPPKAKRIEGMIEFEFEKTRDPNTNTVPRERLLQAMAYADVLRAEHQRSGRALPEFKWEERGPNNVSGRTRALCVDQSDPTGNTVWTGGVAGGIWKTGNMLAQRPFWTPIGDYFENVAISSIAQDPSDLQTIYAGTGEGWFNADALRGFGIWKTSDGGDTWTQLTTTRSASFYYVNKIVVTGDGIVYAATNSGLFRSLDKGESWNSVLGGRTTDLELASSGILYAGSSGSGIYRSATGNQGDWQRLAGGLPTSGYARVELAVSESNPDVLYGLFAASNGSVLTIMRSINGGDNWIAVNNPPALGNANFAGSQAWYDLIAEVDPRNPDRIFIGGIDVLVSSNGGSSWTQIGQWYGGGGIQYVHADQHNIVFHPGSSDTIYFTNDGGIFRTTNGRSTVPNITFVSNGFNVTQFYSCAVHPEAGRSWFLGGTQDNGSQLFTNDGMNDTREVTGGDGGFVHIDQLNPEIQISSYINNNYYITNAGWGPGSVTSVSIGSNTGYFINPTDYDSREKILYCSHEPGQYAVVRNVGTQNTTETIPLGAIGGNRIAAVTVSPNVENRVYFGLSNGNVYVVDNANTTTPSARLIRSGNGFVSCVAVQQDDENHLLVTYSNYGVAKVFESRNGGQTWINNTGNLPDIPVRWAVFSPLDPQAVVLATELGIWGTDLLAGTVTSWQPASDGLGNTRIDMLQIRESDNLLVAGTHGRGMYTSSVFLKEQAIIKTDQLIGYVGSPIQFTDNSIGEFESRLWDFGDGNTSGEGSPEHIYRDTGSYTVTLTVSPELRTQIRIRVLPGKPLPFITGSAEYSGDFERNPGDFASLTISGSAFERGNSAVSAKSGTRSGQYAWVLGPDEPLYQHRTVAALYTPKYDFSAQGIYEISFYAKYGIGPFDGFQVQYTTDAGRTWSVLGTNVTGWYNTLSSAPGAAFEPGQPYFSGSQTSFRHYRLNISEFSGLPEIAFRFVFRSQASGSYAGLAIDDFEVSQFAGIDHTEVISLTGAFTTDRKPKLDWQTLPEYFCQGFRVELSENGIKWDSIGYVAAVGFSAQPRLYSFTAPSARSRDLYFGRLYVHNVNQNTGEDLSFYTRQVVIRKNLTGTAVFQAFPTLTRDHINLVFTNVVEEEVRVRVFAINGQLLADTHTVPGAGFLRYELPNLVPGTYVLYTEIPTASYNNAIKFVVH